MTTDHVWLRTDEAVDAAQERARDVMLFIAIGDPGPDN